MMIDERIKRLVGKLAALREQDSPNFVPITLDDETAARAGAGRNTVIYSGDSDPVEINGSGQAIRNKSKIFGASHHRYRLNPPVDPAKLAEVERQLGRPLPEGYRQWLLEVGDGGAGPCYGLLPLADNPFNADPEDIVNLAADFPFTLDQPCRLPDDSDAGEGERMAAILQGIAFLAHEGCGMYDILVLRGPSAGQVWWMETDFVVACPIFHPDTGQPFDFLGWYELWLDRALDPDQESLGSYSEFLRDEG